MRKQKNFDISQLNIINPPLENTTSKIGLREVYTERKNDMNEFTLFIAHFNNIPNFTYDFSVNGTIPQSV
ncbi:MAG: hypothetical protein NTX03_12540 [Bacteroidetes bacterium]|nr:hypothetical protein [Bacteroidota bacterium]